MSDCFAGQPLARFADSANCRSLPPPASPTGRRLYQGKRLVLALEDEAGVDQLHACGGNARCTTCRVEFVIGEPDQMTAAEKQVLASRGLSGVRLSCQILCDHDMTARAISRLAGSGRNDAGNRPADDIQPQPVQWVPK